MDLAALGIVSKFALFFEGMWEEARDNCFDCFPDFGHVFWRFIEEWAVGTIRNNSDPRLLGHRPPMWPVWATLA